MLNRDGALRSSLAFGPQSLIASCILNSYNESTFLYFGPTAQVQVFSNNESPGERTQLFKDLEKLLDSDFEQLIFALNPPSSQIPPSSQKQALRVSALLKWAQNDGPGLEEVKNVLNLVLGVELDVPRKGVVEITCPVDDIDSIDPKFLGEILLFAQGTLGKASIKLRAFDEKEARNER